MSRDAPPKIRTAIDGDPFYSGAMERIMSTLLPPGFFSKADAHHFHKLLPLISWTPFQDIPFNISFFFCGRMRPGAFHFFNEMICRWLIPGKRMNALVQFAIDFTIPTLGHDVYMGGEVMIRIETKKELEMLQRQLPIIESEIRLGIDSRYQAGRILEIKGLTSDEKTAAIQENISTLIKRRPQDFDFDIYSEMQHFLVLCRDEFKETRSATHMSRILSVHYLFRKAMRLSIEAFPERRYISVKLLRASVKTQEGFKNVLGLVVGMSFLRENEVFEERHLLNAVATIVPGANAVEGSFFTSTSKSDPTRMFYLEVEKENGLPFTLEEHGKLKKELSTILKGRIEERLNPLFMPENEEEVMRHILSLAKQVKYVRDLPQAVINFHKQTQEDLEFSVVIVRVANPKARSLQKTFESRKSRLKVVHSRTKNVGSLKKRYEKVATVFRLAIAKSPFLRLDHSIDLYKARSEVAAELTDVLGDFRDYNGGIISKESELFSELSNCVEENKKNSFLLENFFYSISPAVMRSVLPVEPLKKLFNMLVRAESDNIVPTWHCQYLIQEDEEYFYLLLILEDASCREAIEEAIEKLKIPSLQLAMCFVDTTQHPCFGIIYRNNDHAKSVALQLAVEDAVSALK